MKLPFTLDQFLTVFELYNRAIWPAQLLAYALAAFALGWAMARPSGAAGRSLGLVLAAFWLINGLGYHLTWFSAINGAAVPAGILFALEGALLAAFALAGRLAFAPRRDAWAAAGWAFIAYAAVVYPLLGLAFGHVYPRAPILGVAPCPTTIFTFGVFLLAERRVPRTLLVVPLLWSLFAVSAAFLLGVWQDLLLPVAGIAGTIGAVVRGRVAGAGVGGEPAPG